MQLLGKQPFMFSWTAGSNPVLTFFKMITKTITNLPDGATIRPFKDGYMIMQKHGEAIILTREQFSSLVKFGNEVDKDDSGNKIGVIIFSDSDYTDDVLITICACKPEYGNRLKLKYQKILDGILDKNLVFNDKMNKIDFNSKDYKDQIDKLQKELIDSFTDEEKELNEKITIINQPLILYQEVEIL